MAISGDFVTKAIPVHRDFGFSASITLGAAGSPVGTVKLQGCNDLERRENIEDATVINWFDIATGGDRIVSGAVVAGGTLELKDPECMYRWLRLSYDFTSGAHTVTIRVSCKALR